MSSRRTIRAVANHIIQYLIIMTPFFRRVQNLEFLNSYPLKRYEARRLKKSFRGSNLYRNLDRFLKNGVDGIMPHVLLLYGKIRFWPDKKILLCHAVIAKILDNDRLYIFFSILFLCFCFFQNMVFQCLRSITQRVMLNKTQNI